MGVPPTGRICPETGNQLRTRNPQHQKPGSLSVKVEGGDNVGNETALADVLNLKKIADKDEGPNDKALGFKLPVSLDYVAQGNSSG